MCKDSGISEEGARPETERCLMKAGSYIEHKASGKRTPIKDEGNGYYISIWTEKKTEAQGNPDFPRQA